MPRKTLDDLIKGRVANGSKSRLLTALTPIEEDTLISYPIYIMANCGFPLTHTMLRPLHGQLQRDMERVIALSWSMDREKSG